VSEKTWKGQGAPYGNAYRQGRGKKHVVRGRNEGVGEKENHEIQNLDKVVAVRLEPVKEQRPGDCKSDEPDGGGGRSAKKLSKN